MDQEATFGPFFFTNRSQCNTQKIFHSNWELYELLIVWKKETLFSSNYFSLNYAFPYHVGSHSMIKRAFGLQRQHSIL